MSEIMFRMRIPGFKSLASQDEYQILSSMKDIAYPGIRFVIGCSNGVV